jgi:hypothetical protein
LTNRRRSKQEIIELYQACNAKLGKAPGIQRFCKISGLKQSELDYYWAPLSEFIREAGGEPGKFVLRLSDEEVFEDYARVCLHRGKIPTEKELRIAQRELKTKTHTVSERDGSIGVFQERFRKWLETSRPEFKVILQYHGWSRPKAERQSKMSASGSRVLPLPQLHPFLPASLQYFDVLARGDLPPYESPDVSPSTLFEKRTADAFRSLGFEIQPLGQGTGRNPDTIALARRERFAVIIDAKMRTNGYTLGTEDRKFLEYAVNNGKELLRQGFDKVYLAVVGSFFRESDLKKLTEYLSESPVRSVDMITATTLMRIVEDSIRERNTFSLADIDKQLFGNKII